MNAIDTYGYILIDTEEKRKKYAPKLKTDEILTDRWHNNTTPDGEFWSEWIYRRRIDPGAGYEIVGLDEKEVAATELTTDGVNWLANIGIFPERTIREVIDKGVTYDFKPILAFRRKSAAVKSEKFIMVGAGSIFPEFFDTYEKAVESVEGLSAPSGDTFTVYKCEPVAKVETIPAKTTITKL